jgi:hypothetical protein
MGLAALSSDTLWDAMVTMVRYAPALAADFSRSSHGFDFNKDFLGIRMPLKTAMQPSRAPILICASGSRWQVKKS